jgi:hypothetical protein
VCLARDLTAMMTRNAHHHDGARGVRCSGVGDVRRLLLRPARGFGFINVEEANKPGSVGKADGQSAGVGRRTSLSPQNASRAHGRADWTENACLPWTVAR